MTLQIFKALLKGHKTRGEGGVLWVDGDVCAYCFPDEFSNEQFRRGLCDVLERPEADDLFIVVVKTEDRAHIVSYTRKHVFETVKDWVVGNAAITIQKNVRMSLVKSSKRM